MKWFKLSFLSLFFYPSDCGYPHFNGCRRWEVENNRAKLIEKRHYVHHGSLLFLGGFERFLIETHTRNLVMNWRWCLMDHRLPRLFSDYATFVIDRFHVARDIQDIFRKHPRYRAIRKKLVAYDAEEDGESTGLSCFVGLDKENGNIACQLWIVEPRFKIETSRSKMVGTVWAQNGHGAFRTVQDNAEG